MSNIYRRKDGRFEARLSSGFTDTGKRKYKSFYGATAEEAAQKMQRFISNSWFDSENKLTVKNIFDEWIAVVEFRDKQSTIANYKGKARGHILPAFGDVLAQNLTSADVQKFVSSKIKSGLSANYVSDIVALLKSVYRYASRVHNIRNPIENVILPKRKKAEVRLLSKPEQMRLQKHLRKNENETSLGIALSYFTGIRLGELCALKWKDVDLKNKTLKINRTMQRICLEKGTRLVITEPKSATSIREIPIPDCMLSMLNKFKTNNEFYLLSSDFKPVEPRTMQYRFQSVLKKENLPSIHFHALRHMFATNCIMLGFDVKSLSEILGHSGVETTLNRYVHSSFDRKKSFMNRMTFAA